MGGKKQAKVTGSIKLLILPKYKEIGTVMLILRMILLVFNFSELLFTREI